MQSLHLIAPHRAEWRDIPEPRLTGSHDALVRPTAVTACGLDIAAVAGLAGDHEPFPIGHEFVGTVVDVGDDVQRVAPGDNTVVTFQISCGRCRHCARGLTANCTSVAHHSMYGLAPWSGADWGGAFADLVWVPYADSMCRRLPADASPALASIGDNTTDAWRAVGPYITARHEPVLVVGRGPVPVASVAVAIALDAPTTFLTDDEADARCAANLGAEVELVDTFPHRHGRFPVTAAGGGDPDAVRCAIRSTESGGVCTDTGIIFERTTPLPLLDMYDTGITFRTGRAHVVASIDPVLDLWRSGRLDPDTLIQSRADWHDADRAVSELTDKLLVTRRRPMSVGGPASTAAHDSTPHQTSSPAPHRATTAHRPHRR